MTKEHEINYLNENNLGSGQSHSLSVKSPQPSPSLYVESLFRECRRSVWRLREVGIRYFTELLCVLEKEVYPKVQLSLGF